MVPATSSPLNPIEGVSDPEGWLRHDRELQSWAAVENGKPVGQITLTRAEPGDDAARVWHKHTGGEIRRLAIPARLFVHPDHRGNWAGRLLMETATKFAQTRELSIAFDVMLKDHAAIRLDERLGAERVDKLSHQYGTGKSEPAVVYTLSPLTRQVLTRLATRQ
ncbi:GNAT family N-acetyltransferase [Promicromonospora sp. NPDC059942]|uniref:GNAT family N-acetyltransferase n=1 Tax=Promicromonospora sp. NPDC059942 TaxID=3347009 RepID=UPI00365BFBEB